MSELEERLNAVLSNPEEMSRLADMAQKLMGNLAPESAAPSAPPSGGLAGLAAGLGGGGGRPPGERSRLPTRLRRI